MPWWDPSLEQTGADQPGHGHERQPVSPPGGATGAGQTASDHDRHADHANGEPGPLAAVDSLAEYRAGKRRCRQRLYGGDQGGDPGAHAKLDGVDRGAQIHALRKETKRCLADELCCSQARLVAAKPPQRE